MQSVGTAEPARELRTCMLWDDPTVRPSTRGVPSEYRTVPCEYPTPYTSPQLLGRLADGETSTDSQPWERYESC